jgi:CheY-like chemotaxis protein
MILQKSRILVVDDDMSCRLLISEELKEEGYEVITASHPIMALRLFKEHGPFDLVILDFKMPEMNGLELRNEMSEIDGRIPFIFITSYDPSDLDNLRIIDDYVIKSPNFISELMPTIKKLLEKK